MRCIGATVILLVLLYTQDAAADHDKKELQEKCSNKYKAVPCEGGEDWIQMSDGRCVKLFKEFKNYEDAETHCNEQCGNLVSMHHLDHQMTVLCILFRTYGPEKKQRVWIGGQRQTDGWYGWNDGTEWEFEAWNKNQPDFFHQKEACLEMNRLMWGGWNDNECPIKQPYVCVMTPE